MRCRCPPLPSRPCPCPCRPRRPRSRRCRRCRLLPALPLPRRPSRLSLPAYRPTLRPSSCPTSTQKGRSTTEGGSSSSSDADRHNTTRQPNPLLLTSAPLAGHPSISSLLSSSTSHHWLRILALWAPLSSLSDILSYLSLVSISSLHPFMNGAASRVAAPLVLLLVPRCVHCASFLPLSCCLAAGSPLFRCVELVAGLCTCLFVTDRVAPRLVVTSRGCW